MGSNRTSSARGVLAVFIILVSTLMLVTVAIEDEAAAFQDAVTCSSATPEGCYDVVVECDSVTPGQGVVTISYTGADALTSASAYADGLGGFFVASEYPASFTLTDGSWGISAFGSTATESLSYQEQLWVSCGYVCTSGDMDTCATACDVDGAVVADECFVAVVECSPNGLIQVSVSAMTAGTIGASVGDWEAQLTTYSANMQVNAQTIGFASTDDPTFVIDPLPNGSYRVVVELQSLAGTTEINGAVSATLDCGTTPCPAGDCDFEFFSIELTCTGDLNMVIVGSVPVLSVDQVENITIMVNDQELPADAVFGLSAIDQLPPFPDGDGIRESIYINVATTPVAVDTYDIVAMIDGTSIYNQSFSTTLVEQIDSAGCAEVTIDCASLTVSAQVLLASDAFGEPGWYEIPGLFSDAVTLIVYDANGLVVDWAPQGADFPDPTTRIANPLTASLAAAAQPLTWEIGNSQDWGFFTADDVARLANGELQEVWFPWEEGTVECAPPSISLTTTVVPCTNSTTPNGSIELTPTLANGASLDGITLDATGEQRTADPYRWTGLAGGTFEFSADSNPVIAIDPVVVPDCPVPAISFVSNVQPCTSYVGNAQIELNATLSGGATLTSITLAETGEELTDPPFVWEGLSGGSYTFAAVSNPADTPAPVTIEPCPEPVIEVLAVDSTCATNDDGTVMIQATATGGAALTVTIDGAAHTFDSAAPSAFTWTELAAATYAPDVAPVPDSVVVNGLQAITVPSCVEPSITLSPVAVCAANGAPGSVTVEVVTYGGASLSGMRLAGAPSDLISTPGPYEWTGLSSGIYVLSASRPEPTSAEVVGQGLVVVPDCDSVTITATVSPCTNEAEPDGAIELDSALVGAATLTSITLVQTSEQLTDAPFVWSGLTGGTYTFAVDSSPGSSVDIVTIDPCPPEPATITFTPTFECVLGTGLAVGSVLLDVDVAGGVGFAGVRLAETGTEIAAPGPYLFDDLAPGVYTFELIDPLGPAEVVTEATFLLPYCTTDATQCSSNALGEGYVEVRQLNLDEQMSVTLDATGETLSGPGPLRWTDLLPGVYTFSTSGVPVGITIHPLEVPMCESSISDVVVECDSQAFTLTRGDIELVFDLDPGASVGRLELNPVGRSSTSGRFFGVDPGDYTIDFPEAHPSIESIPVTVPICPEAVLVDVVEECPGGEAVVLTFEVITFGDFAYSGVALQDFRSGEQLAFQSAPGPYEFSLPAGPVDLVLIGASVVDPPGPFDLETRYYGPSCAELDVVETQSTCSSNANGTLTVEVATQRPDVEITIVLGGTLSYATASGPTASGTYVAEFSGLDAGTYPLIEYELGLNNAGPGLAIQQTGFLSQAGLNDTYRQDISLSELGFGEVVVASCVSVQPDAVDVECAADDTGSVSFTFPNQPEITSIELIERSEAITAPEPWEWNGLAAGTYTFAIDEGTSLTIEPIVVPACPDLEVTFDILCSSGSDGRVEALVETTGDVEVRSLTLTRTLAGQVDSQTALAPGPFVFEALAPGLYGVEIDSDPLVVVSQDVLVTSCSVYADIYQSPTCNSITLQLRTIGSAFVDGIVMQPGDRPVGDGSSLLLFASLDPGIYSFEVDSHPALELDPIEILGCPEISVQSLDVTCNSGGAGAFNGEILLTVETSGPVVLSGLSLGAETITGPGPYLWTGLSGGLKTIDIDADAELSLEPIDVPQCPDFHVSSITADCTDDGENQITLFVNAVHGAEVDSITLSPLGETITGPGPSYVWVGMDAGVYSFEVVSTPALEIDPIEVGDQCPTVSLSPTWLCTGPGVSTVFANVETTGLATVNSVSFGYWNGGLSPALLLEETIVAPGPYEWTEVAALPSTVAYGLTVDARPFELETWLVVPGECEVDSTTAIACASPGIADGIVTVDLHDASVVGSDAAGVQEVSLDGDVLAFPRRSEAPGPYVFDELEAGDYVVQIGKIPNELARHPVVVTECAQAVVVAASCANGVAGTNGTITIAVTGANDVKLTIDGVTNVNVGQWTGLAAATYSVTASETVADLPIEIEVPSCPKAVPLAPAMGAARAIITTTCDADGNAVVEVTEDEVFGTVVVGFVINGVFGARQIVPNGVPIDVVILTVNANDNTALLGPSIAPVCLTVSQASSEPEEPQFVALAVPPAPPFAVPPAATSASTTVSVPLPANFLSGVTVPGTGLVPSEVAAAEDEKVEVVTGVSTTSPEPAPAKVAPELASTSPMSVPAAISAGVTVSGQSEIVLPVACDVDELNIEGVTNLARQGTTADGLPRFTADGAQLAVGTHHFDVDCDGTPVSVELFVYRQIGGSRGEGNSVARLAVLSGLLLLVITGATSVATSKFVDVALGGTDV